MVDQPNPGDIQPSFSISFGGGWLLKTLRVFDKEFGRCPGQDPYGEAVSRVSYDSYEGVVVLGRF